MTDDLPEIVIAELGKNAREVIRVSLAAFKGTSILNLWCYYRDPAGNLRPGKGGIAVSLRHLPALAEAMAMALQTARDSGRLPSS